MRSTTPSSGACDEGEVGPLVIETRKREETIEREREREREKREGGRGKKKKWKSQRCHASDVTSRRWPRTNRPTTTRKRGECQTWGYVHSSPKKACYTTGTPIVLTGQRASFDSRLLSFPAGVNLWPIPMEIFPRTTSSSSGRVHSVADESDDLLHSFLAIVLSSVLPFLFFFL